MVEELKKIQNIQAKCTNPDCSFTFSVKLSSKTTENFKCPFCNQEIALTQMYGNVIYYNEAVDHLNKAMKEHRFTII